MQKIALELAVQDLAGARIASDVGARRVEVCSALGACGGLTPSAALIEAAIDAAAVVPESAGAPLLEVHVLVRPRPGGFVLSPDERDLMVRETVLSVDAGADAVVVGALRPDGTVDDDAVRALVAAAGDAEVTFHRAIDAVPDPLAALDVLADLGVTRVLTSGGSERARDGLSLLAKLAAHSEELGVEIMAGGGVLPADVATLAATGIDAIHLSAKRFVASDAGPSGGADPGYETTDPSVAQAAAAAVRDLRLR